MEWRRLKNIILILLVFLNVFLLVLLLSRQLEAAAYERTAILQAVEALGGSGIEADPETLLAADDLSPIIFLRDTGKEESIAASLLGGPVSGGSLGGGLTQYTADSGEVSFRYGGEISADFRDQDRWHTDNPRAHAEDLLQAMGLQADYLSTAEERDGTTLVYRQSWNGAPLFSCLVSFTYQQGSLRSLQGTLMVPGSVYQESGTVLSVPTALMRFLDGILDSGDVCSSINSLTPGYTVVQSFSSDVRMSPVWLVSTNTGQYYLDAITGDLTRVEADTVPPALPLPE